VGRLLAGLQQRGLLERSLVILTADHGEELFDHEGFEHGHAKYDEVIRVPLMMWGAGVEPDRVPGPVSLIDIVPTALEALGVEMPADLPGFSLLAGRESPGAAVDPPRSVVSELSLYGPETKAIVEWPYKVVLDFESGEARLFDLSVDPGERVDLAPTMTAEVRDMLGAMSDIVAEAKQYGVAVEAQLDEELRRRLRSLGYIR
jgi:arylsulfatase A-like enzyme